MKPLPNLTLKEEQSVILKKGRIVILVPNWNCILTTDTAAAL
jgi:uridylate kinase